MKKFLYPVLLATGLLACQPPADVPQATAGSALMPVAEIDEFIGAKMQQEGRFDWSMAPDQLAWSALTQSDQVLSVGYRPAGTTGDFRDQMHTLDVKAPAWQAARQQLLDLIFAEERKTQPALKRGELEVFSEDVLPVFDVRVKNLVTLQKLRQSPLVRYAEPMGYEPGVADRQARVASGSGCGSNTGNPNLVAGSDYTTTTPNGKVSWNLPYHNIPQAWAQSSGAGITVQIIDSGCSPDQAKLGSQFNQGDSPGRSITKLVTLPRATFFGIPTGPVETPADLCGHGTSMLGTCAGPRGTDGTTVGVAYGANLVSVRAATDVLIDESREVKGVADAFRMAGDNPTRRIVSLSLGRLTSSGQMTDAIRYAYNRGVLIFAAAGTSFSFTSFVGVIFPANLAECVAVTGVKEAVMQKCDACHDGGDVEFVTVMEKTGSNLHGLSLAMSGDVPSTVGGSSVATSSTAGMAALVWAKFPGLSRSQILDKLKTSASYYPNRNPNLGWGKINVTAALGGVQ
ncbi:MAG: S8/S53 family peptidase [Cytophagaceae bacterium]|nr:S8/S53 family peptidase [Cytophagaceae bacterium]